MLKQIILTPSDVERLSTIGDDLLEIDSYIEDKTQNGELVNGEYIVQLLANPLSSIQSILEALKNI